MNGNAKHLTITIRVNADTKDALLRRAVQTNAIASGRPSISMVVDKLIQTARRHWPKEDTK